MPAATFRLLPSISGNPNSVVMDAAGDLFGTTQFGGANNDGSVFEIANTSTGYASTATVVVSFSGTDGYDPNGPLLFDATGNLLGTTQEGGPGFSRTSTGDGTLFEIANTSTGYASVPITVVNFDGGNGLFPVGGLIADSAGNLLGVTEGGIGTVFEVANTTSGYAGTPTTLSGDVGNFPRAGLTADSAGDLFGTTSEGGTSGEGNVFEVANTATGYASTPTTLVSFNGGTGKYPGSGLLVDAAGDLFGITESGGANGDGAVFEIVNTSTGYASTANLLASFTSVNGNYGNLIQDAAGNFFVTSSLGGANGDGAVYEIADTGNGYAISPVFSFDGSNGQEPGATLVADAAGDLFGTTPYANGGVFELMGSGFQAAPAASAPTLLSITAFPDTGDATTGTLVTLTATMSKAVTVSRGIPSLALNDGGSATYDAGKSSGTALVFDYTVQAGQSTSALAVSGFNANGATIQDTSGDNASFVRPPTVFSGLAVNFAVLANFNFTGSGGGPNSGLIADATGDLFGTTVQGGTSGDGTVFEIANTSTGYAATPTTLINFDGGDGNLPVGDLLADSAGDLFGITVAGGSSSDGTLFEIANTGSGHASSPTTLVTFNGANGALPHGRLITDGAGDLFGTTQQGGTGPNAAGTVFELPYIGGGYASTPTTLVTFDGTDGGQPLSGLITDASGDLFGTTGGGADGYGTVFEIANTSTGYASTPTTLVSFNGTDGFAPVSGLVADAAGDLFGVGSGSSGGVSSGGTVFEVPFVGGQYASTPTTLLTFTGQDGDFPMGPLIVDAAGDLFGTTTGGGANNDGTVFEIANTSTGYASTATVLLSFNGTDGSQPAGRLLADSTGDLFGTTQYGGTTDNGTVFELTSAAFQAACYRAGTRIATPTGERAIDALAKGDAILLASGHVQPVVWIGQRRIDCRRHGQPKNVWPVRVRVGAFGAGSPRRDLWLSPDHAVFVNGVLIPIKYLTNGTSIAQKRVAEITYYHLELAQHAIVLAEGLPAESWLNCGDRAHFDDAARVSPEVLRLRPNPAMLWETRGCAPLIVAGPKLAKARMVVAARAAAMRDAGRAVYTAIQLLPGATGGPFPGAIRCDRESVIANRHQAPPLAGHIR